MAKNKIEIDVEVDDKGRTKKLGLESKKTAKGMDDVGKGARTADRNIKGAAQASSGASKNFSKMSQGMGGLVGAYATLAANIFAITAAFGFFKRAADVAALSRGQEAYALKTGKSMKLLTSRVQEATGGILAFNEASQAVAIGTAAGLSSDQLTGLATVAKNASVALGRDLTDSFNRLTRGAIKAEPELLDELGIIIRLNTVTEEYGRVLNKAAEDLTQFEKTQAVVNAVLSQGNEKFDEVGNNINQVARLGKKFNDLVKSVGDFIDPLTKFISGALANNIIGLTAAFSGLGISIGRALMPAMPAMESIDDLAGDARTKLAGIAGEGPTADKIRAGDFDEQTLNRMKKAHQSKTSTVLNLSKMEKAERIKNIRLVETAHKYSLAQQEKGVKKWYLNWKANLAALQLEHGKRMGTIKAMTAAMVSGVNKVLSGLAIVGMLYTVITLAKEFIETFKDPAIKEMEENAKLLEERFKNQNKEIRKLIMGFKEGKSPMETLVKQANILSNFSFSGIEGMVDNLEKANMTTQTTFSGPGQSRTSIVRETPDQNKEIVKTTEEVIATMLLQEKALQKFGIEADGATAKFSQGLQALQPHLAVLQNGGASADEYNAALEALQGGFEGVVAQAAALNPILAAQNAAIKSIGQTTEGFQKFRESIGQASSKFSQFLGFNKQFQEALNTLKFEDTMAKFFDGTQDGLANMNAFADILGVSLDTLKAMTKEQVVAKLTAQDVKIRQAEHAIEVKSLKTQQKITRISAAKSPLQLAAIQRQAKVLNIQDSILKAQQNIKFLEEAGAKRDETKIQQENEKLNLLLEQLAVAENLTSESERQLAAAKSGMESSASKEFAALLKGEESSIKDSFARIAKSSVDAVIDTMAQNMAKNLTDFVFGSPEDTLEVAMNANTAAINANTTALGGTPAAPITGGGGGLIGSITSKAKGFFGGLFGGGTTNPNIPSVGGSTTGLGTQTGDATITSPITGGDITVDEIIATGSGAATSNIENLFRGFTDNLKDIFSGDAPFLEGLGNLFKDAGTDFMNIFGDLGSGLMGLLKGAGGGLMSMFGFANGGIAKGGFRSAAYSKGGVVKSPTVGLVGEGQYNEAIVPLPDGKKIPVEMRGGGDQNNNIVVNVASDGSVSTQGAGGQTKADQERMGKAIGQAVREEMKKQKKSRRYA